MDTTMNIQKGQVVKSKAGRDKGRVFLIYDIVDEYSVLVVDGDLRKIESPKLKKMKHLSVYNTVLDDFIEILNSNKKINNALIRRYLEPFN